MQQQTTCYFYARSISYKMQRNSCLNTLIHAHTRKINMQNLIFDWLTLHMTHQHCLNARSQTLQANNTPQAMCMAQTLKCMAVELYWYRLLSMSINIAWDLPFAAQLLRLLAKY